MNIALRKAIAKAGGIGIVAAYFSWIRHEEEEGRFESS